MTINHTQVHKSFMLNTTTSINRNDVRMMEVAKLRRHIFHKSGNAGIGKAGSAGHNSCPTRRRRSNINWLIIGVSPYANLSDTVRRDD